MGTICIVHVPSGEIEYKLRTGNRTNEELMEIAREKKLSMFPAPSYEIREIDFKRNPGGLVERVGFYLKVTFDSLPESVVIPKKFRTEKAAQKWKDRYYGLGNPGAVKCEILQSSDITV